MNKTTRREALKNFKVSGVTRHAIQQAFSKGAPVFRPKKLKKMTKRGEVRPVPAIAERTAFVYQDEFVYITNKQRTTVITVLTWREYKNIMYPPS